MLLWGHYLIPHWHIQSFRVAYWDMFGKPPTTPKYALGFDSWWVDTVKAGTLDDTSMLKPDIHIWTASKQPWVTIPEDMEAHEKNSP